VQHVDVLIVGAGLSGIAAGYHLGSTCPDRTYEIWEARDAIGGTWDLFRYPGIRSDSDMFTFSYPFRPWPGEQSIGDGAATDVAGANRYGVDSLFIASGIHGEALIKDGALSMAAVAQTLAEAGAQARYVMPALG
jgi:cation diffusion facilitator CzcD-associated flavoprotein CzcO